MVNWKEDIEPLLKNIQKTNPAFNPADLKKYLEEGFGAPGIHFYKIAYQPGDIIMARGVRSDYAAIHVSGQIKGTHTKVGDSGLGPLPRCWDRPGPLFAPWSSGSSTAPIATPRSSIGTSRRRPRGTNTGPYRRGLQAFFTSSGLASDAVRAIWPGLTMRRPACRRSDRRCRVHHPESFTGQARHGAVHWRHWRNLEQAEIIDPHCRRQRGRPGLDQTQGAAGDHRKVPALYQRRITNFLEKTLPIRLGQNRLFRGLKDEQLNALRDLIVGSVPSEQSHSLIVRYPKEPWKRQLKQGPHGRPDRHLQVGRPSGCTLSDPEWDGPGVPRKPRRAHDSEPPGKRGLLRSVMHRGGGCT